MSDIRVVLLMLALAPSLAFAQAPELEAPPLVKVEEARESAPEDASVREEARPSARAGAEAQWAPESPERVAGRVLVESMGGAVAGVGGGFLGVLAVLPLGGMAGDCAVGASCGNEGDGLVAGALMGWSLGAALGVYGSGSMLQGRGRLLPTLGLGLLAGGAATGLCVTDVVDADLIPLMLALPLATSIITYEVTSAWEQPRPPAAVAREDGLWWTPTVGVSSHGGVVGLAGHF